jgi:hypothetical protein
MPVYFADCQVFTKQGAKIARTTSIVCVWFLGQNFDENRRKTKKFAPTSK